MAQEKRTKEEIAEWKRQTAMIKKMHEDMLRAQDQIKEEDKIAPEGAYISLRNINKVYDNHVQAVFDFNLDIKKHELIVFVGPSGCGKSTTLRMIAGLESITTGDLFIDGVYCNEKTSKERDVAMVFQNYALYPHMTVYENMAFGLKIRHFTKEEIDERVRKAAEILQITEYLSRRPKELSGGQRQRVALGRAIVREAKVFLMDEPLSNLDAKLRVSMRSEIIKLHRQINATTIYVTHDQTEAMTMADRIVVMKEGYIQQIGTPEEIYNHPANTFVATFIGAPAMNLLTCQYKKGKVTFENGFTLTLSKAQVKAHQDFYQRQIDLLKKAIEDKEYENVDTSLLLSYREERGGLKDLFKKKVTYMKVKTPEEKKKEMEDKIAHYEKCLKEEHTIIFGVRPEDIYDKEEVGSKVHVSDELKLPITIAELLGSEYHLHMDFAGHDFIVKCKVFQSLKDKEELEITFDLDKIHLFDEINKELIF